MSIIINCAEFGSYMFDAFRVRVHPYYPMVCYNEFLAWTVVKKVFTNIKACIVI